MTQQDEGEGMRMTLEERIEKAARVFWPEEGTAVPGMYVDEARMIILAAFPELFASPPEAWLAPVELTDEDVRAVHVANLVPIHGLERESAARDLWRHMVRPHLTPKESP